MTESSSWDRILQQIQDDPRYQKNIAWGKPRSGHPEGSVAAHISELEQNLNHLRPRLTNDETGRLRLLIHTHDTFKAEAVEGVPIAHPRSHASLARAFLCEYCDDADLQAMVQYHDEPYALWQKFRSKKIIDQPRLDRLLTAIQNWDLFRVFQIIDACTVGKSREPIRWSLTHIKPENANRWTTNDIF